MRFKSEHVFVTDNKNKFQTRGWHEGVDYRGIQKYPGSRNYEANIGSNRIGKNEKNYEML